MEEESAGTPLLVTLTTMVLVEALAGAVQLMTPELGPIVMPEGWEPRLKVSESGGTSESAAAAVTVKAADPWTNWLGMGVISRPCKTVRVREVEE